MSAGERVLIVGASLGGLRTAEALRKQGFSGEVLVAGEESRHPYNRPPLSKDFLAGRADERSIAFPLRPSVADVEWRLGIRIAAADLAEKTVTTDDGASISYDDLVIATGLRPRRLRVPGDGLPGTFALRTLEDAAGLRARLADRPRVLVIGAGFVGCEVAATCRCLECEVVVVGRDTIAMGKALGAELGTEMMRRHRQHGVRFVMEREVTAILGEDRVERVMLDSGDTVDCDLIVEAIGSEFNVEWLDGNGLDAQRGVRTDSCLRAIRGGSDALPTVFAVGDVARFPNARFGVSAAAVEHWNIPTETSKRAAQIIAAAQKGPAALARAEESGFAPVPSFWSDQYDNHILAYGMPALGERVELLSGDPRGDGVYGFYLGSSLVGVCGVGDMPAIMRYRNEVGVADAADRPE